MRGFCPRCLGRTGMNNELVADARNGRCWDFTDHSRRGDSSRPGLAEQKDWGFMWDRRWVWHTVCAMVSEALVEARSLQHRVEMFQCATDLKRCETLSVTALLQEYTDEAELPLQRFRGVYV